MSQSSPSIFLGIEQQGLEAAGAYWTAREISQQPDIWQDVAQLIEVQRDSLDSWLAPLMAKSDLRIILTGAGTSAYVGKTLAPYLTQKLGRRVEAISTTDLVSNPDQFLLSASPTLLISYARSGNSPESIGAYQLADQIVNDCHHLVVVCNAEGDLAKAVRKARNSYCLLMPTPTLDQSFAMTSSYTAMLLGTIWVFAADENQLAGAICAARHVLKSLLPKIRTQAQSPFQRIAFIGSGGLLGIATEAALKMLELSAGAVDCYAESPLGFRHGPKSMINDQTMIIMLNSRNTYCCRYDHDLVEELKREAQTPHLYCLGDDTLLADPGLEDIWLALPYIVYCQSLAFFKSLALKVTPDNPCPSGEVNRVVQGVALYPFGG